MLGRHYKRFDILTWAYQNHKASVSRVKNNEVVKIIHVGKIKTDGEIPSQ